MENNVRAILDGLNDEQRKAVQCVDGPVLIVAGAGSGKTRVLTSRVAYLLAEGVDPSRILALTFTKKAAGEMKERIALMVGQYKARRVVMGTFHSVFIRFLRDYAESLGYPKEFTIYDQGDSVSAVKAVIKELNLDDAVYKPRDVQSRISSAKNHLVTVSAYRADRNALMADTHSKKPRIIDIYDRYQQRLKQSGVMDFDDILVNMNILLRDNKEALASIAARFSYIMVDEYQDTNLAQYIIIKKLSSGHHNICVVGDDSQSIYAFRGAQIQNILNFRKDYPESKIFRLERNYRSTPTIVDAANSVIEHNSGRIPKKCFAEGAPGEKLHLIQAFTEQDEAVEIVSAIQKRMRGDGAAYQDFAILYRTNSQSRALEEQLRRRNIPYIVYSGNSFFERAEVKDMMAYFKLVVNPMDDESFKRVVNKPARAIGDTSVKALEAAALAHGTTLFRAAFADDLEAYGLRSAAVQKVRAFCAMIDSLNQSVKTLGAFDLARQIADKSGLYAFYQADTSIEGMARFANVEELVNSVASFEEERRDEAEGAEDTFTLDDFLENVSLLSNVDLSEDEDTNNKVALMTVHSAKGLEFPYVFVTGMEENLFPSQSMMLSQKDLEEERRLFYVAITRAGKAVTLSYAGTRMRNGRHESNSPSRFLRDIDSRYLERPVEDDPVGFGGFSGVSRGYVNGRGPSPAKKPIQVPSAPAAPDPNFIPSPMTDFYVGERIEHNRFGAGEILEITGKVPELKARVRFDELGEKLLLLKYAKMRPEGSK
ncbi:MAG: UvrD-helicase domain-containing protein [Bacteroidales bacterium]|nr:UvrD-helicase domain-containing protein [Bacteroidales bacterium]